MMRVSREHKNDNTINGLPENLAFLVSIYFDYESRPLKSPLN